MPGDMGRRVAPSLLARPERSLARPGSPDAGGRAQTRVAFSTNWFLPRMARGTAVPEAVVGGGDRHDDAHRKRAS